MTKSLSGKLGYGIIGTGSMGPQHMEGVVRSHNSELRAICDVLKENVGSAARKYGMALQNCYVDYREMLVRDDIDVVIVSTPDQLHKEHTILSLEAGKHVLCEKPMALTVEECRHMVEASKRYGKKLMVGQICRYAPGFVMAKKLIEDGQIGTLFFVESEYAHDYSHVQGVGNWRLDPVKLRHPVIGGGCHAVDLLRWIAGNPYEVIAYASGKVLKSWPVSDCTIAMLRFPDGVLGKVFVSVGCKRSYTMRSVFYGDKGTIIADNTTPYISLYKENIADEYKLFQGKYPGVMEQRIALQLPVKIESHNTYAEVNEFSQIILDGKPVITDGLEGASTVAVCCAIVDSAGKDGEKVKVNYDL